MRIGALSMEWQVVFPTDNRLKTLLHTYNPAKHPRLWRHAPRYSPDTDYYPLCMLNSFMLERENKLARTKGTRTKKESSFGDYSFIRVSLDATEKEAAIKWVSRAADELDAALTVVLKSGHKCSFSYNETNDSVTCTFTGKPDESINEYKMLTSFASSWWQALAVNLYKFHELFKGGVWESEADEEAFG